MAEKIIGRHQETNLLNQYLHSGKAEFIAIYGRRRIGKTFLIRQFFKNNFSAQRICSVAGVGAKPLLTENNSSKPNPHTLVCGLGASTHVPSSIPP